jgi:hypothetical protein
MPSEGNWMPFVYKRQLYVSYSICPHTVLTVDPTSGNCTLAFTTNASAARCKPGEDILRGASLRGSVTSPFPIDEGRSILGLGHTRGGGIGMSYFHFLFKRRAVPPFDITGRSEEFRLPMYLSRFVPQLGPRADALQFCLSIRTDGDTNRPDLIFDYAARDAIALTMRVPYAEYCNFTQWCSGAN